MNLIVANDQSKTNTDNYLDNKIIFVIIVFFSEIYKYIVLYTHSMRWVLCKQTKYIFKIQKEVIWVVSSEGVCACVWMVPVEDCLT